MRKGETDDTKRHNGQTFGALVLNFIVTLFAALLKLLLLGRTNKNKFSLYVTCLIVTLPSDFNKNRRMSKKEITREPASASEERAVLVALVTPGQNERTTRDYLDELAFLSLTAGARAVSRFSQRCGGPNSTTYVGSGKLQEIRQFILSEEEAGRPVSMAIFDDELSARQLRNIEKTLCVKILDRTSLILDIFAMRAQTAAAKTQVELAQYRYMLPRLQRMWTHLERQGGASGSVGLRGPGETQLEMDRRIILSRMSLLKRRLSDIDRQKSTQRQNRGRMVRVALVGYTNVGKSTLMNLLSGSEVKAENKLFATLDTTIRKVVSFGLPFLLGDTVGFIRKLPIDLVDSFKSTLDEVREADLLVHVVDVSHPDFEQQMAVTQNTLAEIGAGEKPGIVVFNKIDAYTYIKKDADDLTPREKANWPLEELMATWMAQTGDCIFVSAMDGTGIPRLRRLLFDRVRTLHVQKYPYTDVTYGFYGEVES